MLNTIDVYNEVFDRLNNKESFSLIRMGDGESLCLGQNTLLTDEEVRKRSYSEKYKDTWLEKDGGITIGREKHSVMLYKSILDSTIVGVPNSGDFYKEENYLPLMKKSMGSRGIDFEGLNKCDCLINYRLYFTDFYQRILRQYRVVLIGRQSKEVMKHHKVVGFIDKINNMDDVEVILKDLYKYRNKFDVVLVGAGIPGCIISTETSNWGKVSIDIGHMMDGLSGIRDGRFPDLRDSKGVPKFKEKWRLIETFKYLKKDW